MTSVWGRVAVLALCFLALFINASVGATGWVVVMAVCIAVNAYLLGASIGERVPGGLR